MFFAGLLARISRKNRPFALGLAISLLLHALVLALKLAAPNGLTQEAPPPPEARIDATLMAPRKPVAPKPAESTPKTDSRPRVLAMPRRADRPAPSVPSYPDLPERNWSREERNEMDQFLNDLAQEAKPRTGAELAQRALAMARTMRLPLTEESDPSSKIMRKLAEAKVEPFSLESYLNALFTKMNRSAAMLGNRPRPQGVKPAAVRIYLNRDGSVKKFEILRAADQQAEIDFIHSVVDFAAPFPVFPADIGRATDALIIQVCIRPDLFGSGSGSAFTRMGPGESCL